MRRANIKTPDLDSPNSIFKPPGSRFGARSKFRHNNTIMPQVFKLNPISRAGATPGRQLTSVPVKLDARLSITPRQIGAHSKFQHNNTILSQVFKPCHLLAGGIIFYRWLVEEDESKKGSVGLELLLWQPAGRRTRARP